MYRILVTDDEKMECEALNDILTHEYGQKAKLYFATNGTEALRTAVEVKADIILMDIKMPGMSGLEASKEILRILPDCKIIIYTGYTYFSYAKECVRIGASDLLVKPCAREEIIAVVNKAMTEIDHTRSEKQDSEAHRQRMRMAKGYAKREIVASIVYSNADESEIRAYLNMLDVDFTTAMACIVNFTGRDDREKDEAFRAIGELLRREERALCCYHIRGIRMYCLLFGKEDARWTDHIAGQIEALCRAQGNIWLSRSAQLTDLSDIFGAFSMLRMRKSPDQADNGAMDAKTRHQIEETMVQDLHEKRVLNAMRLLEVLMDSIALSGENITQRFFELLLLLNRSVYDYENVPSVYPLYSVLEKCTEMSSYKCVVTDYAEQIIDILTQEEEKKPEWAAQCARYIEAHYQEDVTLDEVAQVFSYSPYYFSKLFKRDFKISFIDYLTRLRIEKAKELLSEGKMNVREISDTIGFADPNYFTRVFKRETGTTPTAFQKMLKTNLC